MALVGCSDNSPNRKYALSVHNGTGWNSGVSVIHCDSFQMDGVKKATIWVDGTKINIEADRVIYPIIP